MRETDRKRQIDHDIRKRRKQMARLDFLVDVALARTARGPVPRALFILAGAFPYGLTVFLFRDQIWPERYKTEAKANGS
jgi:hypothetical protein